MNDGAPENIPSILFKLVTSHLETAVAIVAAAVGFAPTAVAIVAVAVAVGFAPTAVAIVASTIGSAAHATAATVVSEAKAVFVVAVFRATPLPVALRALPHTCAAAVLEQVWAPILTGRCRASRFGDLSSGGGRNAPPSFVAASRLGGYFYIQWKHFMRQSVL